MKYEFPITEIISEIGKIDSVKVELWYPRVFRIWKRFLAQNDRNQEIQNFKISSFTLFIKRYFKT